MPRPMRILVIDDNSDDRQLVLRELTALWPGVIAIEVNDLATFEAALEARPADLVVTDLDLRWADGRDIFVATKKLYPACPVVMFTGTGDETIAVALIKAGLDDYVVKSPRQMPRLRASLRMAVEIATSRNALSEREAQLTALAAHKDMIARELHHRVKNNLQMIMSLLQLRSRQVDDTTRGHLQEMAGRMEALALVQEHIYDADALDRVDFSASLSEIAEGLTNTIGGYHISLDRDFDGPLELEVGRAMPLGLLCYELILNALKHAWPQAQRGKLTVELRTQDAHPEVKIIDDGAGFEEETVTKGLGTRLVRSLATEAKAEVLTSSKPGDGTTVTLRLV
ncbi:sensor histidine kinase [Erythrobacter sp. QSSC1-22B]|uniref:sensor histidine kinase n=1 Tax=Erythrobacter sp. QSSC1-22B TaxID=1860125 RepID=UPI001F33961C|nr:histidine kinase dimerization/phosphoacceptor domain -containing protein [Erythrobacter sp. QSSC1-22B]